MDSLIQYCYQKPDLMRGFVSSSDSDLIESFYRLMMHYGLSVQEFFNLCLVEEINLTIQDSTHALLRGPEIWNKLFKEYFTRHGGRFGTIIQRIRYIASTMGSSDRQMKKAIEASLGVLEESLVSSTSDELLDFCNNVCVRVNGLEDQEGETIVGSFIFFGIISPLLVSSGKVKPSLTTLNKALLQVLRGNADLLLKWKKYVPAWHERFRNIIRTALMRRKDANYRKRTPLSSEQFEHWQKIFLNRLDAYRKSHLINPDIRRLKQTMSQQEFRIITPIDSSARERHERITEAFRSQTLNDLHVSAIPSKRKHGTRGRKKNSCPEPHADTEVSTDTKIGRLSNDTKIPGVSTDKKIGGVNTDTKIGGVSTDTKIGGVSTDTKIGGVSTDTKIGGVSTEEEPHRIGTVPISFTLERLLEKAKTTQVLSSLSNDLRFVVLWNPADVQGLLSQHKIDVNFFRLWNINGRGLLECTKETLVSMRYPGHIETLLELINNLREFALLDPEELSIGDLPKWTLREVCLWLTLSNLDELVETFTRLDITGAKLTQLTLDEFRDMQISRPIHLCKLARLQDDYAAYESPTINSPSSEMRDEIGDSSDYSTIQFSDED